MYHFKVVADLAHCGEQLRADTSTPWLDGEATTALAENELLGAANSIEEAAVKLARLRPRQVHVSRLLILKIFHILFIIITTIIKDELIFIILMLHLILICLVFLG